MPSDNGSNDSSPHRRRLIILIITVLVIIGGVWLVRTLSYSRSHESTDDAQVDGDIIPVLSKVGGYVTKTTVDENQPVKAGQLLLSIDAAEYRVQVEQAQADLAAAQAAAGNNGRTGQSQAQVATATGQHQALDAQILAAEAANTRAQADLARMRDLAAKQIISQQQLDATHAAAEAAQAQLLAARRQAQAAGAQVSTARAGVRIAQARLQGAKAAVDNATLQLGYTQVIAPASGVASRKQVEVGQLVTPGQPLLSIVSDSGVWITANFKETQMSHIRIGQLVEFEVDAYGGCRAEGRVESVSGATGARFALLPPDNATGNFTKVVQRIPVRIAVIRACDQRPLRPGMSVDVHVRTQ